MKFAVIADDVSFPVLSGVVRHWQGELAAVGGPVGDERVPPGVRVWGNLSDEVPEAVDVVLASGARSSITSATPSLVRRGLPVWLIPEAGLGSDFVYAQIPLDEEFPDRLRAVWPLRQALAVIEVQRQLTTGDLGAVLHLQMERTGSGGSSFTPALAEAAWLHDADLLRSLGGGDYRRVTAIHSGLSAQGISTASVGLSGEGVPDAMWAFRGGAAARAELTITTERGSSVLLWEGDSAPTLTINCRVVELPAPVGRARLLPSCEPETTSTSSSGSTGASPSRESPSLPVGVTPWSEAVRTFDLLDAARRSLVRRRTVELQFESTSERSQFKTHMTTVGCGLLLFTMFGLIGLLFVGRMFDPRDTQQKQSEVAGFVLTDDHFEGAVAAGEGTELSSFGQEALTGIIDNYQRRSATILIAGESQPADSLGHQRRAVVLRELKSAHLKDVEVRTLVRPIQGVWFKRGMVAGWVVLFLPLGIFLAMQMFIGVTPAGSRRSNTTSD